MILDTSAMIAIVVGEPDRGALVDAILAAPRCRMSAGSYLETCLVVDSRHNPVVSRHLDTLLESLGVEIEPFTADHVATARQAYRDFGKGSGHPARLNFGDCFAYALAHATSEPLLFVGDDFVHTDVQVALPRATA